MQITSPAPIAPTTAAYAPAAPTASTQPRTPLRSLAQVAPASPYAPLAIEGATDGVQRLAVPPIVDFPGIKAGDVFEVVKGSKAGPISVRGNAWIQRFDPDHATFRVKAGRFGLNVDVVVDIVQLDAERVRITSKGSGVPDAEAIGRIVETRTNFAKFVDQDDPSRTTTISFDGRNQVVIDAAIPTVGDAHLVLERS